MFGVTDRRTIEHLIEFILTVEHCLNSGLKTWNKTSNLKEINALLLFSPCCRATFCKIFSFFCNLVPCKHFEFNAILRSFNWTACWFCFRAVVSRLEWSHARNVIDNVECIGQDWAVLWCFTSEKQPYNSHFKLMSNNNVVFSPLKMTFKSSLCFPLVSACPLTCMLYNPTWGQQGALFLPACEQPKLMLIVLRLINNTMKQI